ncbi:MAG: lysylphosphatidylglycerol synthase transmembrane domain-containing protein [Candidatus Peribacteraceae bacterium]|nr:lysylphosphatidylglycerol synthase transmembrane domain-containing protein [Candidatus Peribacteraceae bacterium]MDD5075192.1 lysylphosphatidylglycerol synthase transmembrane domain-containing protein [Candidatus Peribacteraceae bacterium]
MRIVRHGMQIIGVFLFAWVLTTTDIHLIIRTLSEVPPRFLVGTLLLFPVIYTLRSIRWHILTRSMGSRVPFAESLRMYYAGIFLGMITPGRIGEAARIPFLTQQGITVRRGVLLTVLDRIFDIGCIGIVSVVAIGILWSWPLAAMIAGTLAIMGLLLVLYRGKISSMFPVVYSTLRSNSSLTLLTMVSWGFYFVQLAILRQGFALDLPLVPFFSIMTLAGIISIMPIAPAGLGTRDAFVAVMFLRYHIPTETSIAFTATIFLLTFIGSLMGLYAWFHPPLKPH